MTNANAKEFQGKESVEAEINHHVSRARTQSVNRQSTTQNSSDDEGEWETSKIA